MTRGMIFIDEEETDVFEEGLKPWLEVPAASPASLRGRMVRGLNVVRILSDLLLCFRCPHAVSYRCGGIRSRARDRSRERA